MKRLTLGDGLTLPPDCITQTFAALAVRGAGKSNLGAVMAEEMFAAGLPFVAIDPSALGAACAPAATARRTAVCRSPSSAAATGICRSSAAPARPSRTSSRSSVSRASWT